jgi:hypothetical protein
MAARANNTPTRRRGCPFPLPPRAAAGRAVPQRLEARRRHRGGCHDARGGGGAGDAVDSRRRRPHAAGAARGGWGGAGQAALFMRGGNASMLQGRRPSLCFSRAGKPAATRACQAHSTILHLHFIHRPQPYPDRPLAGQPAACPAAAPPLAAMSCQPSCLWPPPLAAPRPIPDTNTRSLLPGNLWHP